MDFLNKKTTTGSFAKTAREMYEEHLKADFGGNLPDFWKKLRLHDCEVYLARFDENDFIMVFEEGDIKVTFKNAKIIEQEDDICGAFWVYDELYKSENGYEIHAMLAKYGGKKTEYLYLTVDCRDVILA